jgi:hypothetical protein
MVLNISLLKNQNLIQLGFFLQYFFFRAKVFALAQTYAAAATFLCRALALQFLHAHGGRRRGTATGDEQQQAFFMEQGALRCVSGTSPRATSPAWTAATPSATTAGCSTSSLRLTSARNRSGACRSSAPRPCHLRRGRGEAAYVDDNIAVKWCPSVPHCGRAIRTAAAITPLETTVAATNSFFARERCSARPRQEGNRAGGDGYARRLGHNFTRVGGVFSIAKRSGAQIGSRWRGFFSISLKNKD